MTLSRIVLIVLALVWAPFASAKVVTATPGLAIVDGQPVFVSASGVRSLSSSAEGSLQAVGAPISEPVSKAFDRVSWSYAATAQMECEYEHTKSTRKRYSTQ